MPLPEPYETLISQTRIDEEKLIKKIEKDVDSGLHSQRAHFYGAEAIRGFEDAYDFYRRALAESAKVLIELGAELQTGE